MTIKEKLEAAAVAILAIDSSLHPEVTLGISREDAMVILAAADAPLKKSIYPESWTVIASRTIKIGGVSFKAQSDQRPITGPEKAAYLRSLELHEEARRMEEKLAELREAATRTREEANRYGDEAMEQEHAA
jgi:hypothetical protein